MKLFQNFIQFFLLIEDHTGAAPFLSSTVITICRVYSNERVSSTNVRGWTEYIFRLRDKMRPVEVSKQGRTLLSEGELLLSAIVGRKE